MRLRLSVALWGLLIVLTALAGWQVYVFFTTPIESYTPVMPDVGARQGDLARSPYATAPSAGPIGPGRVLRDEGRQPLRADPLGIAPPPGATRTGGFQRSFGREMEQLATYTLRGDESSVADYYRQAVTARGYQMLKDSPGRDGLRTLIFWRDAAGQVVLTIQTRSAAGRLIEFTLKAMGQAPAK